MSLKPQNLVQAAKADLARRERNRGRYPFTDPLIDGPMEPYAFHRKHVSKAENVRDLLVRAANNPSVAVPETRDDKPVTAKRETAIIYGDTDLIRRAIELCDKEA